MNYLLARIRSGFIRYICSMNRFILFGRICVLFWLISGCSEDFQLTEPYKDIPIVYGFLNRTDSAHYIRVEKLFVDENIPATEMAKVIDSIYYKNAVVKLFNKTKNKEYTLQRVDVSQEGYQRKPGNFALIPNYMYKIDSNSIRWDGGDSIIFKLDRGDNKPLVTARIAMLKDFYFTTPDATKRQLNFSLKSNAPVQSFSWAASPGVGLYDFELHIHIIETDKNANTTVAKTLKMKLAKDELINSYTFTNKQFYYFLANSLEADIKYKRTITSIDLIVIAGGNEIKSFNLIQNANLGITASQEIPRYTNISEGFGLLSSIHVIKRSFGIEPETITNLDTSFITSQLNFR